MSGRESKIYRQILREAVQLADKRKPFTSVELFDLKSKTGLTYDDLATYLGCSAIQLKKINSDDAVGNYYMRYVYHQFVKNYRNKWVEEIR